MASRTRNAGRTTFLSPEMTAFLRRRLQELAGGVLFLCGIALSISILGYDSSDPSWNHAVSRDAANPLGPGGAWLSDLLIQSIGAMAIVPGIVLMVWGWRIGAHRAMGRTWIRMAALPLTLLLGAIALAAFGTPSAWPVKIGLGGITGSVLLADLSRLASAIGTPLWTIALAAGALAVIAFGLTLGVSRGEWITGLKGAGRLGGRVGGRTAKAGVTGGRWTGRMAQRVGGASWSMFRPLAARAAPIGSAMPPKIAWNLRRRKKSLPHAVKNRRPANAPPKRISAGSISIPANIPCRRWMCWTSRRKITAKTSRTKKRCRKTRVSSNRCSRILVSAVVSSRSAPAPSSRFTSWSLRPGPNRPA